MNAGKIMNIVVFGVSGFIGKAIVRKLLSEGHNVMAVTREKSFDKLKKEFNNNIKLYVADITEKISLDIAKRSVDVFINAAGSIDLSANKNLLYNVNTIAVKNILDFGVKIGIKKFIQINSVSAIGGFEKNKDEKSIPFPLDNYGFTKLIAEFLIYQYCNEHNIVAIIMEVATVYGPGDNKNIARILSIFDKKIVLNINLKNYYVNLIYIDDLVNAVLLALGKKVNGVERFIISGKKPVSLEKIYNLVLSVFDQNPIKVTVSVNFLKIATSTLKYVNNKKLYTYLKGLEDCPIYSIKKAYSVLGYKPQVGIKEGVKQTISFYIEKKKNKLT